MARVTLKGIHRVRMKLAGGKVRDYHYAFRGGPCFWNSDSAVKIGSPQYIADFSATAPKTDYSDGKFRSVIREFLGSPEFKGLGQRYQKDIRSSVFNPNDGIDKGFGDAPTAAFNDARIRGRAIRWRDTIASDRTADARMAHLTRIVSFAYDWALVTANHLLKIKGRYSVDRSAIIWTDQEIDVFVERAPKHVARILIAATETGLRPGDLAELTRFQIQATPKGRRLLIKSNKRQRMVNIPVTERMGKLIDSTPEGQSRIIVGKKGQPYKNPNYLGDAVSAARDAIYAEAPSAIRNTIRLYDARGAAATRLLRAGADMKEIAVSMGWSIAIATAVIESYVAPHPDFADELGKKIAQFEENDSRKKL